MLGVLGRTPVLALAVVVGAPALGVALGARTLTAQEPAAPAHVYEAFYRLAFDDLEEWNRQYREYSVPILTELVEAGAIQGWSQWQHNTGSEYNVRFTVRTHDWASIGTFWDEYLSRLQEATPADEWESGARMILAHRDEIWDVAEVHVPQGLNTAYLYAATFRVNFADMAEWNRAWTEVAAPILEEAMEEGILGGWVRLGHNTGGPHNSKVLYLFEAWDHIDDLFDKLLSELAEAHSEDFELVNRLIRAHDDAIWVPTPVEGM